MFDIFKIFLVLLLKKWFPYLYYTPRVTNLLESSSESLAFTPRVTGLLESSK